MISNKSTFRIFLSQSAKCKCQWLEAHGPEGACAIQRGERTCVVRPGQGFRASRQDPSCHSELRQSGRLLTQQGYKGLGRRYQHRRRRKKISHAGTEFCEQIDRQPGRT